MADVEFQTLRREIRRKLNLDPQRAMLGDANGTIYEDFQRGLVRVRQETADGFSLEKVVRFRGSMAMRAGAVVTLGYDEDGELAVLNPNFNGQVQQGVSPFTNNANDQNRTKYVNQSQLTTLLSHLPADKGSEVVVQPWIYLRDGEVHQFNGERVDVSAHWPGAGLHRLAGLFLTTDDTIEVATSTTQNTLDPLTIDDVQEAVDNSSLHSAPVWFWTLAGVEGTLNLADSFIDGRQVLNVPSAPLFTQTAIGSLGNSALETSILYSGIGSQTLAANYFKVGRHLRVNLRGHLSDAVTPGTLDIRLKAGSTQLCNANFDALNGSKSDTYFEAHFEVVCQQTGASGKVVAGGEVEIDGEIEGAVQTGQITLDTTAAHVLDVLAIWQTADPANVLTTQIASIEAVK